VFIIFREKSSWCGRKYLQLQGTEFVWIDTADFDTWDEAKAQATAFSQVDTAIILRMLQTEDGRREYQYEAEPHR
jgi:hypothetical protein